MVVRRTALWVVLAAAVVLGVTALNGPNVCMVKQKYNITKRVKYRAPMSVRTYEWCLSIPPRCSKWNIEMRDLTRLETDERTAEVAVCCPGYKMKEVSCVPICPNGKTGPGCTKDCDPDKWGPNCVHKCGPCEKGVCSAVTGECLCQEGWQGESCGTRMPSTTTAMTTLEEILTKNATKISSSPKTTPSTVAMTTITEKPTISITSLSTITSSTTTATLPITSTFATERLNKQIILSKQQEVTKKSTDSTTSVHRNVSISSDPIIYKPPEEVTTYTYNRTDTPSTKATKSFIEATSQPQLSKGLIMITTESPKSVTTPLRSLTRIETSRSETTTRASTTKFKPKEIWIRPAQKGEIFIETKIKPSESQTRQRSVTNKDIPSNTTPKTIIVSIIPTSVSYATFKKIALTSAINFPVEANVTEKDSVTTTEPAVTNPMSSSLR